MFASSSFPQVDFHFFSLFNDSTWLVCWYLIHQINHLWQWVIEVMSSNLHFNIILWYMSTEMLVSHLRHHHQNLNLNMFAQCWAARGNTIFCYLNLICLAFNNAHPSDGTNHCVVGVCLCFLGRVCQNMWFWLTFVTRTVDWGGGLWIAGVWAVNSWPSHPSTYSSARG